MPAAREHLLLAGLVQFPRMGLSPQRKTIQVWVLFYRSDAPYEEIVHCGVLRLLAVIFPNQLVIVRQLLAIRRAPYDTKPVINDFRRNQSHP